MSAPVRFACYEALDVAEYDRVTREVGIEGCAILSMFRLSSIDRAATRHHHDCKVRIKELADGVYSISPANFSVASPPIPTITLGEDASRLEAALPHAKQCGDDLQVFVHDREQIYGIRETLKDTK